VVVILFVRFLPRPHTHATYSSAICPAELPMQTALKQLEYNRVQPQPAVAQQVPFHDTCSVCTTHATHLSATCASSASSAASCVASPLITASRSLWSSTCTAQNNDVRVWQNAAKVLQAFDSMAASAGLPVDTWCQLQPAGHLVPAAVAGAHFCLQGQDHR
jgi:hypothetical protein